MLVVGDAYVPSETFREAFRRLSLSNNIRFIQMNEADRIIPSSISEKSIREYSGNPQQIVKSLQSDDEVLIVHDAPVTDAVIDASPSLKLVCCARGGPVNIDISAATKRKILVVSSPGRNAEAVADYVLGAIIILARNLIMANNFLKERKKFERKMYEAFFGHELGGKTLGLIGFGNVGSKVAKRALAFGMNILVYDPFLDKSAIEGPGIAVSDLESLISKSDYVSLHARESKENENMIGKKQFALMKSTAFFINSARGSLVDEEALIEALEERKIAGAALDVLKQEPVAPDNKILSFSNVFITPHIGGASMEVPLRGAEIIANQIEKFISHERLSGVINPEVLLPY